MRLAAERKRAHGQLCNKILREGRDIKLEVLSYRRSKRPWSANFDTPSEILLKRALTRKAESAGGMVTRINTWKTRLSQYDHTTDDYVKKPQGLDAHYFRDGKTEPVQRDIYSAFLARHCDSETHLDVMSVRENWPVAASLLARVPSGCKQSANAFPYGEFGAGVSNDNGCGADHTQEGNMLPREAPASGENAAGSAQNPSIYGNTNGSAERGAVYGSS